MLPIAVTNHLQTTFRPIAKKLFSPENLSTVATKLPFLINQTLIEQVCNKVFLEQINEGEFEFLTNKHLQVEIIDAQLYVILTYQNNRLCCTGFAKESNHSEVTLSISTLDAISLIQQEVDPDTLFFQRKLKIKGDTELAHHIKNTIDTLNPDLLPRFIMKVINEYKKQLQH